MTHLKLSLSIPSKWSFGQMSSRVVCLADFWMTSCPRWNIDMICSKTRQCHLNVSDCKESQYDKEEARHCCVVVELPKKLWAPTERLLAKLSILVWIPLSWVMVLSFELWIGVNEVQRLWVWKSVECNGWASFWIFTRVERWPTHHSHTTPQ